MSITMGTAEKTRLESTAAVVQVVHPRFDSPASMNFFIFPNFFLIEKSCIVSMALTTALVIGRRSKIDASFGFDKNFFHVQAIMASSVRRFLSGSS